MKTTLWVPLLATTSFHASYRPMIVLFCNYFFSILNFVYCICFFLVLIPFLSFYFTSYLCQLPFSITLCFIAALSVSAFCILYFFLTRKRITNKLNKKNISQLSSCWCQRVENMQHESNQAISFSNNEESYH